MVEATETDLAEAAAEVLPRDEDLVSVRNMALDVYQLSRQIEHTEEQLAELKNKLKDLQEVQLPAKLAQIGLSGVPLSNGWQLVLKPFTNCSIIKEKAPEALNWLRDNGAADLIKNTISVAFGKGEDNEAARLYQHLVGERNLPATQDTIIHYQTLNAWVREEVKQGRSIPTALFNLYIGSKAELKAPKK